MHTCIEFSHDIASIYPYQNDIPGNIRTTQNQAKKNPEYKNVEYITWEVFKIIPENNINKHKLPAVNFKEGITKCSNEVCNKVTNVRQHSKLCWRTFVTLL